jgi:hypothetical protein
MRFNNDVSAESCLAQKPLQNLPCRRKLVQSRHWPQPRIPREHSGQLPRHAGSGTRSRRRRNAFPKAGIVFRGCHLYKDKVQTSHDPYRDAEVLQLIEMSDASCCRRTGRVSQGEEGDAGNAYASGERKNCCCLPAGHLLRGVRQSKRTTSRSCSSTTRAAQSTCGRNDKRTRSFRLSIRAPRRARGRRLCAARTFLTGGPTRSMPTQLNPRLHRLYDGKSPLPVLPGEALYPFGFGPAHCLDYDAPKLSTKRGLGQGVGSKSKSLTPVKWQATKSIGVRSRHRRGRPRPEFPAVRV